MILTGRKVLFKTLTCSYPEGAGHMKSSSDSHFSLPQRSQERMFRGNASKVEAVNSHPIYAATSTIGPTQEEIKTLAYQCWQRRGCPAGTPELDWLQAENELKMTSKAPNLSRAAAV